MSLDRWQLTAETLEHLLVFLDPDRDAAARKYEALRSRLIRLFVWRGCDAPEERTDETLDRVARKLKEGVTIRSEPFNYAAGVAYRIFQEMLRRDQRQRRALEEMAETPPPEPDDDEAARLDCLDECLDALAGRERDLIVGFYRGEKGARIARRKRLAEELGISVNALRIRAYRLRARLEGCVRECLTRGGNETAVADIPD